MTATTESKMPLATVHGLYHIAIKTEDLAATRKFWVDIIGLREFPRPDFGYPGAWLGCPQPGGLAIIHVYAGGPARVRKARLLQAPEPSITFRCRARAIAPMFRVSSPLDLIGANSSCREHRCGSCSSTIRAAFSWS